VQTLGIGQEAIQIKNNARDHQYGMAEILAYRLTGLPNCLKLPARRKAKPIESAKYTADESPFSQRCMISATR
jgi:hypothetical protein